MENNERNPSTTGGLRRELGMIDVAAIFVGIIIGSGIFVAPKAVAQASPGIGSAVLLWITGGLVAACGAFCYAECASRLPETGGFYVYFRRVYGEGTAFVGGWAAILVTYPASIAAIAWIFAEYFSKVFPGLSESKAALGAVAILVAATLNALGVKLGVMAQRILTGTKVLALLLLCLAGLFAPAHPEAAGVSTTFFDLKVGLQGLLGAMIGILWTYDGWSDITMVAGEVKDPTRNLGRAVLLGTSILILIYALAQISVGLLLTPTEVANSGSVLADAVQAGLGFVTGRALALLVVISTLGSINGIVFAASRLGFAVLRDVPLLRAAAHVNPRTGAPTRSIAIVAAFSIVYLTVGDFGMLLGFFSFTVWLFYGLTAIALLVLRKNDVGDPSGWRAPGGPIPPVMVLLTGAVMTSSLLQTEWKQSLIGLGLLLVGYPVYFARRWASKRAA
jgi:APA family basic amino acid/polyamine antiporter